MSLRRLFPPSGLAYQLFDSAIFLLVLAYLWYVGSDPSAVTKTALSGTLEIILNVRTWGIGLMAVGLTSAVLAYRGRRAVLTGYVLMVAATSAWSISLFVGSAVADGGRELIFKALGSALLFAWISRRLVTEVISASEAQGIDS